MKKQKILIVDDEQDMRIFLSTLFETSGYKIIEAEDGQEGIKAAGDNIPDLITLDIMMPKEGGIFMYQQLKTNERLKHIPVIILSAIAKKTFNHYLKMLNIKLGGIVPQPEAYMEKPPEAEELLGIAQNLLNQA
ncbi:Two component system response regulator [Desulfonema limicola]|uniref:Two component system response regulator n=1 Tax=Desulfonema limicola TaxID=45656 RepID=A0A975GF70_9BACT|nr:response regulator [Desulfonema limicola]QTA78971.1 Two component system response regulator [Desulfonema limicola]